MGTEIDENKTIRVKRELENGWFQWSTLSLPSSLSIQSGINQPRYATLKGIMSVKSKPVDKCNTDDFNLNLESGYSIEGIHVPKKSKETEIIEGSTDEVVDRLTDILKNEIKIG